MLDFSCVFHCIYRRFLVFAVLLGAVVVANGNAHGDIYRKVDKKGVVHFTNISPKNKAKAGWKTVVQDGSFNGSFDVKGAAKRGGCDRCDLVPAKDRSKERFVRFDSFISEASQLYRVPETLIRAVIKTESDYDPRVVSATGARGLMQLMPAVVKDMGVLEVHDPRQNILGGTRLLRILANRYNGDVVRTIAAYHAGPANLARYGNNVPPSQRTRTYLRIVLERYRKYQAAEKKRAQP